MKRFLRKIAEGAMVLVAAYVCWWVLRSSVRARVTTNADTAPFILRNWSLWLRHLIVVLIVYKVGVWASTKRIEANNESKHQSEQESKRCVR